MDEILVANFMLFQEVVEEGLYDLVVGDEAWDVDHFWHENPELKRGAHVWLTDFVGFLPMPDGGDHEAFLTADYNAEMIEHIAHFPRIRDRSIFVGNPDDVVARHVRAGPADDPRLDRGALRLLRLHHRLHTADARRGGRVAGRARLPRRRAGVRRHRRRLRRRPRPAASKAIAAHPIARRASRSCARSPWPGPASTPAACRARPASRSTATSIASTATSPSATSPSCRAGSRRRWSSPPPSGRSSTSRSPTTSSRTSTSATGSTSTAPGTCMDFAETDPDASPTRSSATSAGRSPTATSRPTAPHAPRR